MIAKFLVWFSTIVCTGLIALQPAHAQATPGANVSTLTVEEVRRLAEQVKQMPDLTEATRGQIQELYNQAVEQLELAEGWRTKAREFEAARLQAPELLRSLTAELERPEAPVGAVSEPGAKLADLEQRLFQTESELEAAMRAQAELEAEKSRRGERRIELPQLAAKGKERLEALSASTEGAPAEAEPAAVSQARQILVRARTQAILREAEAYEQEMLSYETRGDVLQARLGLAARRVAFTERLAETWRQRVYEHRSRAAQAAVLEAQQDVETVHPALRELAEQNVALAGGRREVSDAIEATRKRLAELDERIKQLDEEFRKNQTRVAAAGLTNAIGQFLRRQRAELPKVSRLQRSIRERRRATGEVQVRLIELEDQRTALGSVKTEVDNVLSRLDPGLPQDERRSIQGQTKELVKTRRAYLNAVIDDYGIYFAELVDLDGVERELLAKTQKFARYVDENVLWIKSGTLLGPSDLVKAGQALAWLGQIDGWSGILRSIWGTMRASPFLSLAAASAVLVLLAGQHRVRRRLRKIVSRSAEKATSSVAQMLQALLLTLALAATWPALLWFLAWLLASPYESSDFAKAIAEGLRAVAVIYLSIEIVRKFCVDGGVGARYFKWRKTVRQPLLAGLRWLRWVVLPTAFLAGVMDFQANDAYRESLGRIAFIIGFISLTLFAKRLLRRKGGVIEVLLASDREGWLHQLRYVWHAAALGIPAGLAIGAVVGYYYTAYYLAWRLMETVWVLLALVLFDAVIHLWLQFQMRQRALEDARQAAADQSEQTDTVHADGMRVHLEEEELDEASVSAQASQLLRTGVILGALVGTWLIWAEVLPALSALEKVTLWSTTLESSETITKPDGTTAISKFTRQVPITLADLGLAIFIVIVTVTASRNVPGLLEISLLDRLPFAPSVQYAITSLTKYTIVAVGVVMAFNAIGISWSKVQWLVAAMTVGLAFGLQEIFANFVSGIIILFERPIRVGDVVTVGNVSGVVSRIRIRATTITDWDRKELIVPNKRFITTEILNWTLSDAIIRVVFPVSVARGTEIERVRDILIKLAIEHPLVLPEPEPSIVFKGFGPGSLQFDLRAFIRRDDYAKVLDALNTAIEEGLKEADIEIAVDRQEIQVRPVKEAPRPEKPLSFPPEDS